MKLNRFLCCALFGPLVSSASAETVIKILHLQSNPQIRALWQEAAQQYQGAHPGVKVQFDYLENEAFKSKLPTLLQSKDRPSAFHSWGGGVMYEQVNSGICKDITQQVAEGGFKDTFYPATLQNFTVVGKVYGLPNDAAPIVLWYNRGLCQKAGVDPTKIQYWDDFVDAAKKCQAAGITPAAAGGKGKANDLFASLDGWLVTKEAPNETVDFMKVWLGKDTQTKLAAQGLFIPAVKGTADAIQNPLLKGIAQEIDRSQWIEIAIDQRLGPDIGRVFNDLSADLADGRTTPEKAAKAMEASWQQNRM